MAVIFVVAVFLPSLLLGYLALRTAGQQRVLIEQQAVKLYQNDADALASAIDGEMLDRSNAFAQRVRQLLADRPMDELAANFGAEVGSEWRELGIAFAVAADGRLSSPRSDADDAASAFLRENAAFLSNRLTAELYPTQREEFLKAEESLDRSPAPSAKIGKDKRAAKESSSSMQSRNVVPQRVVEDAEIAQISKVAPEVSDFQTATSRGASGILARFVQNELEVIFWARAPEAEGMVFGVACSADAVRQLVDGIFGRVAMAPEGVCLAILDERALPVARSTTGFQADWKRPFVATEIGEALPHWEAALYLLDPDQLTRSARLVTLTILLLIAAALAAILAGGSLVAIDARRQMVLARKKTDFVSNVSHELKTPLTSIRMFAELLRDGRVEDPEKRTKYLRIIALESERLTRLINNVLDFSRIGRNSEARKLERVDFFPELERLWEAQGEHLRETGFACEWVADPGPYRVIGDADALGQVVVNLLANAEKYGGDAKVIELRSARTDGQLRVAVLDRGIGVPAGEERKIFEAFHRSDDSLASGVTGSGLGLTLAAGIAAQHGGRIEVERREGGGSVFTLIVPLAKRESEGVA